MNNSHAFKKSFCIRAPSNWEKSYMEVWPIITVPRQYICLRWCISAHYHEFSCSSLQFLVIRPAGMNVLLGRVKTIYGSQTVAIEHVEDNRYALMLLSDQVEFRSLKVIANHQSSESSSASIESGSSAKPSKRLVRTDSLLSSDFMEKTLHDIQSGSSLANEKEYKAFSNKFASPSQPTLEDNQENIERNEQDDIRIFHLEEAVPTLENLIHSLRNGYFYQLLMTKTPVVFYAKQLVGKYRTHALEYFAKTKDESFIDELLKLLSSIRSVEAWKENLQSCFQNHLDGKAWHLELDDGASECELVGYRQWLQNALNQDSFESEKPDFIKEFSSLKAKEYELKVLIYFEVLYLLLKIHPEYANQKDSRDKTKNTKLNSKNEKKEKEPPNLFEKVQLQLEFVFDGLCIRRTIEEKPPNSTEDLLLRFCKEGIIPFYSSKFPKITRVLLEKCNGLTLLPDFANPRAKHISRRSKLLSRSNTDSISSLKRLHSTNSVPSSSSSSPVDTKSSNLKRQGSFSSIQNLTRSDSRTSLGEKDMKKRTNNMSRIRNREVALPSSGSLVRHRSSLSEQPHSNNTSELSFTEKLLLASTDSNNGLAQRPVGGITKQDLTRSKTLNSVDSLSDELSTLNQQKQSKSVLVQATPRKRTSFITSFQSPTAAHSAMPDDSPTKVISDDPIIQESPARNAMKSNVFVCVPTTPRKLHTGNDGEKN
ncbi:DNA replication pre-initiation complex subunit Sld3 [Schizosaccharomyces cryophilus OY26]|uniref:DNA replication pre-initiation complex subunit Sld3 n=1 Tax=Schizosaccharomyces cryophilus (strain OY26 / ATCC MYA-4695 / CBS 11777 / NBRC 106824 / NRRL Y48691) TaxID=653667 RepID=S9VU05_SCHCR|nr:DNA replication pre-initiation complex subunit Sld3 [Schizosaccharomyces cryophilus OY26]EPY49664.1 DNA replication pre-initiation complex subunit Sld3 [Schizosaccharomyces cryophilus OY26]